MTKITIPVDSAKNGGALYILVDDLSNLNSEVSKTRDNGTLIIDDSSASPDQRLEINEQTIIDILGEPAGDVEGYLFGIRQPSSSANIDVPAGVPSRLFILGAVKMFSQWFASNADVWLNSVSNEILYFNQPNPSDSIILKASEAELIRQLDPNADDPDPNNRTYFFLTVTEVQALIVDTDWVKL